MRSGGSRVPHIWRLHRQMWVCRMVGESWRVGLLACRWSANVYRCGTDSCGWREVTSAQVSLVVVRPASGGEALPNMGHPAMVEGLVFVRVAWTYINTRELGGGSAHIWRWSVARYGAPDSSWGARFSWGTRFSWVTDFVGTRISGVDSIFLSLGVSCGLGLRGWVRCGGRRGRKTRASLRGFRRGRGRRGCGACSGAFRRACCG